jgi:uncharacterized protein YbjT (DUF2867 family)
MRIFLAGATGVGVRLLPLMLAEDHDVAGMTRTPQKLGRLRAAGVKPTELDPTQPHASCAMSPAARRTRV